MYEMSSQEWVLYDVMQLIIFDVLKVINVNVPWALLV